MPTDAIRAADLAGRQRQRARVVGPIEGTGGQMTPATAAAPALAPSEPPALDHRGWPVEEWEYDVITSETPLTKAELNVLGRRGWIMTSYSGEIGPEDRSRVYYFRRRAQAVARVDGVVQSQST
jgi:hypothetical protein